MLKQLKYFQSVVRLGSFSAAAEENFISQSAISQQVQALERALGFALLERKNRSFTLTPAGDYFYRKSLLLTADYERICIEAAKIAGGGQAALHIGCLRSYSGAAFRRALEQFAEAHPEVSVSIACGNHEELYELLRSGQADIIFNDQRRAFSGEYVNLRLAALPCCTEVSAHSPLAQMAQITPQELKNTPCILVASQSQRAVEQDYYQTVIGFHGDFLFTENLEEARLLVISRRGFLPLENSGGGSSTAIVRVPLVRGGEPILQHFCAFWKKNNSGYYVEAFAELLKAQFQ